MANNFLILCLLSTIAVLSEAQSLGGNCQTPDNQNGACVPIRSCDILFRMVTKTVLLPDDRRFLQRSKCGTKPTDVCCPADADDTTTERFIPSTRRYITPSSTYTTPRRTIAPRTTPPPAAATIESTIRISAKKCNEYADFAYNKTYTVNVISDVPRVTRTSNCGFTSVGLVVGGEEAKRREFPHMALIGFRYNGGTHWDCGGTLISDQFVLSAKHCSYSNDTGPALYARLGEHDLSQTNDASHKDFDIIEAIFHENVSQRTYNDIVLFKLGDKVKFDHVIRPACLNQKLTVPRNVSASGWGSVRSRGRRSSVLLKVDLMTFSPNERDATILGRTYNRLYDEGSIVFAGHLTQRKDTCQGDSGGPLQVLHENLHCTYVLVGVTSGGKGCANIGTPAIYTGIYSHLNWIEETVWSNE